MGDEATGNGEFGIGEPCIATCGEHMKAVRPTTYSHGWVFVLFCFPRPLPPASGPEGLPREGEEDEEGTGEQWGWVGK